MARQRRRPRPRADSFGAPATRQRTCASRRGRRWFFLRRARGAAPASAPGRHARGRPRRRVIWRAAAAARPPGGAGFPSAPGVRDARGRPAAAPAARLFGAPAAPPLRRPRRQAAFFGARAARPPLRRRRAGARAPAVPAGAGARGGRGRLRRLPPHRASSRRWSWGRRGARARRGGRLSFGAPAPRRPLRSPSAPPRRAAPRRHNSNSSPRSRRRPPTCAINR